ncbi:hypothetical protein EON65_42035 [archaeon]|nr:MAG: hypothetical protein EON65_42035 [archaeon]
MDGGLGGGAKQQLSPGPKARICYICGRQYMLHSYEIHLKQCKELWIAREAQKPERERKPLPEDPALRLMGGGGGGKKKKSSAGGGDDGDGDGDNDTNTGGAEGLSLDEINRLANEAYNTESLSTCAHCGRTFLPEKLAIHNKSCTAEHPARRVNEGVRKGTDVPKISQPSPARPSTTSGTRCVQSSPAPDTISEDSEGGHLAGAMGGPAGRNIRKAKTTKAANSAPPPSFGSKEEAIEFLASKVEAMEGMMEEMVRSIAQVKSTITSLSNMS